MLEKLANYIREVKVELQKATWPWDPKEKGFKKYKELVDSTIVVVVAVLFLAAFVSFNDIVMTNVMKLLMPKAEITANMDQ